MTPAERIRALRLLARKLPAEDRETVEWAVDFIEAARRAIGPIVDDMQRAMERAKNVAKQMEEFPWR